MKIISTSNYDDPTVSDCLVCDNVSDEYGNKIVDFLNAERLASEDYYVLVEDDCNLYDANTLYT